MEVGDVREVTTGDCSDLYYIDTGMYGTSEYGAVYILDDDQPAVIETGIGTNSELILDALTEIGIDHEALSVIAVSHIHLDHAGGAGYLAAACPNADVYVSDVGARHLIDPERLVEGTKRVVGKQWEFYAEPKPIPAERITEIADGDVIDLGTHELRVHATPGHAPHQVVFEDPANDAIFTADAAGIWVPSLETIKETSPPPQFDLEQCLTDVATLRERDREVLLYTHFGPREAGDILERYERVLTEWVAAVERERATKDDEAVIDHFRSQAAESAFADIWGERKGRTETAMNVRGVLAYLDEQA